ncbi:MAG: hypothetical protein A3K10_10175 [Bacteroidetes bacterium RIFCSPLOWO2_12_FULL_31_6]|nr:MAG: hypothetical protein A3K10_10175 [Bacteroidetes bacterium RIFCSPLOWO2_12_FULL_31_6]
MKKILSIIAIILHQITISKAQVPNLNWAVSMSGNVSNSIWQSITTDAFGNVYTLGNFDGTIDFNPGAGVNNITSTGNDVFIQKLNSNGNLLWVKTIEGSLSEGYGIIVNSTGEVYLTGIFRGTVDFDPGIGVVNKTALGTSFWSDFFVLKLNVNGDFLWVKTFGGNEDDWVSAMVMDAYGNLFLTGTFLDTVDFDPGIGIFNLISTGWGRDYYVLKLDLNGNFLWVKQMKGGAPSSSDIQLDDNGNIYVLGGIGGIDTVDLDPGIGVFNITNDGGNADVIIQKLDINGDFVWAKSFGNTTATETVNAISMVTDASGNIYIAGFYFGTTDFDPDSGITSLSPVGLSDVFVLKINSIGSLLWAKSFGGTALESVNRIAVDASDDLYLIGQFDGTVDFDPNFGTTLITAVGSGDIYIQKLSENGGLNWVGSVGGSNSDEGLSITVGTSGKVYCTGWYSGVADFNPGAGVYNLNTGTGTGFFVLKLASTVGVEENNNESDFVIYPNPTTNLLSIDIGQQVIKETFIIDITGKTVKSNLPKSNIINVSDLSKGIYFIKLITENSTIIQKFVKD